MILPGGTACRMISAEREITGNAIASPGIFTTSVKFRFVWIKPAGNWSRRVFDREAESTRSIILCNWRMGFTGSGAFFFLLTISDHPHRKEIEKRQKEWYNTLK